MDIDQIEGRYTAHSAASDYTCRALPVQPGRSRSDHRQGCAYNSGVPGFIILMRIFCVVFSKRPIRAAIPSANLSSNPRTEILGTLFARDANRGSSFQGSFDLLYHQAQTPRLISSIGDVLGRNPFQVSCRNVKQGQDRGLKRINSTTALTNLATRCTCSGGASLLRLNCWPRMET